MTFTAEQIKRYIECQTLENEELADKLYIELETELGEEKLDNLAFLPEVGAEIDAIRKAREELKATVAEQLKTVAAREKKAAQRKRRGPLSAPRRVARSPEVWRCLKNYPKYEISSHGRVRSLDRARPGDWLKPRLKWRKGLPVDFIVIYDKDGKRRERMIGYLLIDAGFLPRESWMK